MGVGSRVVRSGNALWPCLCLKSARFGPVVAYYIDIHRYIYCVEIYIDIYVYMMTYVFVLQPNAAPWGQGTSAGRDCSQKPSSQGMAT